MKLSNELKIQISECLLTIFLLLSLASECLEGKISQCRHSIITMEQVVLNYQNQLNGNFLKAYDLKFDRVLNLSVLPVQDTTNLGQSDSFKNLNERFKRGTISASEFEEKASDYFTGLYNEVNRRIRNTSIEVNAVQSEEVYFDLWLKKLNFIKYLVIITILVIQGNLVRSLTRMETKEDVTLQSKSNLNSNLFMSNVYKYSFLIIAIVFIYLTFFGLHTNNIALMKDFSLPLAALLFTAGNLWHIKENQLFEERKHQIERKDKYWDKRLDFYFRLHDLIGKINFEIKDEDVIPPSTGSEFKNTKLSSIYKILQRLEDESQILFDAKEIGDDTGLYKLLKRIREGMEIIMDNMRNIIINKQSMIQIGGSKTEYLDEQTRLFSESAKIKREIEDIFDECRIRIFSYLGLE